MSLALFGLAPVSRRNTRSRCLGPARTFRSLPSALGVPEMFRVLAILSVIALLKKASSSGIDETSPGHTPDVSSSSVSFQPYMGRTRTFFSSSPPQRTPSFSSYSSRPPPASSLRVLSCNFLPSLSPPRSSLAPSSALAPRSPQPSSTRNRALQRRLPSGSLDRRAFGQFFALISPALYFFLPLYSLPSSSSPRHPRRVTNVSKSSPLLPFFLPLQRGRKSPSSSPSTPLFSDWPPMVHRPHTPQRVLSFLVSTGRTSAPFYARSSPAVHGRVRDIPEKGGEEVGGKLASSFSSPRPRAIHRHLAASLYQYPLCFLPSRMSKDGDLPLSVFACPGRTTPSTTSTMSAPTSCGTRLKMVWGYPLFGDDPKKPRRPKIDIAWERGLHRGSVSWEYETANRLAQGM